MDLRHSKATLISLGAVDTTGVPAVNQVARFFDADTVQGSANFTFSGTILALTGNMTISSFLAIGTTPAVAGTIRLPNTASIAFRNNNNAFDLNIISSPMSDQFDFGDANMPRMTHLASATWLSNQLRVNRIADGSTLQILYTTTTVLTPSGQTATAVGFIQAGSILLGLTARVITAITGPAGFDIGDGVDVDRWGNSILTALNTTVRGTDYTSDLLQHYGAANDVVLTSDGVDFTGGEVRLTAAYLTFTAPTS